MKMNKSILLDYEKHLKEEEKATETIKRYISELLKFARFLNEKDISKEKVIQYKKELMDKNMNTRTINAKLSALNGFFKFLSHPEYCVKFLKTQNQVFRSEEKELTKREYEKLVETAYKLRKEQLALILQTICATGIRVSELQFITAESVFNGKAYVNLKGKERIILIPKELRKKLIAFIKKNNIEGIIFVSKNRTPINRRQIWKQMKALCKEAHVSKSKVFPHNLRHLFAMTFYKQNKDIVKLADVLGHSSINTTRIYLISTGKEHAHLLDKLQLVC